jgi:regulatory protein
MRPESNRQFFYKKDMGILARSGFGYDISKKILAMSNKEFNQFLKLI